MISAHLKRLRALIESGAAVSQADIYMIDWATYGAQVAEENARIRIASVGARAAKEEVCFTCFTGTKVQIMTPEEPREAGSKGQAQASALLRTKLQLSLLSLQTALPQSRSRVLVFGPMRRPLFSFFPLSCSGFSLSFFPF